MLSTHEETIGRLALATAVVVEVLTFSLRLMSPSDRHGTLPSSIVAETLSPSSAMPSPPNDEKTIQPPDDQAPISSDAPSLPQVVDWSVTTYVLFRRPYDMVPEIFYASLRRNGRRDATMVDSVASERTTRIQAGPVILELCSIAAPLKMPGLQEVVSEHEAHMILTSAYRTDTPCDQVVRLHHFAHSALAEFAPVLAVLWPSAGRLVWVDDLAGLLSMAAEPDQPMAETCTEIRVLPFDSENGDLIVSDSVGLHAFGLPDVQIVTPGQPSDTAMTALHQLVERLFKSGCDFVDGAEFSLDGGHTWQMTHTRSAIPPDRQVVQIAMNSDR